MGQSYSQTDGEENSDLIAGQQTDVTGDFGLLLLKQRQLNSDDHDNNVEIIAVHGLNGHRKRTWTHVDKATKSIVLWLRDLLPKEVPGARIYTYGYNANLISSSITGVADFAWDFLQAFLAVQSTDEVSYDPLRNLWRF